MKHTVYEIYENKNELKSLSYSGDSSGGTLVRPEGGAVVHIYVLAMGKDVYTEILYLSERENFLNRVFL